MKITRAMKAINRAAGIDTQSSTSTASSSDRTALGGTRIRTGSQAGGGRAGAVVHGDTSGHGGTRVQGGTGSRGGGSEDAHHSAPGGRGPRNATARGPRRVTISGSGGGARDVTARGRRHGGDSTRRVRVGVRVGSTRVGTRIGAGDGSAATGGNEWTTVRRGHRNNAGAASGRVVAGDSRRRSGRGSGAASGRVVAAGVMGDASTSTFSQSNPSIVPSPSIARNRPPREQAFIKPKYKEASSDEEMVSVLNIEDNGDQGSLDQELGLANDGCGATKSTSEAEFKWEPTARSQSAPPAPPLPKWVTTGNSTRALLRQPQPQRPSTVQNVPATGFDTPFSPLHPEQMIGVEQEQRGGTVHGASTRSTDMSIDSPAGIMRTSDMYFAPLHQDQMSGQEQVQSGGTVHGASTGTSDMSTDSPHVNMGTSVGGTGLDNDQDSDDKQGGGGPTTKINGEVERKMQSSSTPLPARSQSAPTVPNLLEGGFIRKREVLSQNKSESSTSTSVKTPPPKKIAAPETPSTDKTAHNAINLMSDGSDDGDEQSRHFLAKKDFANAVGNVQENPEYQFRSIDTYQGKGGVNDQSANGCVVLSTIEAYKHIHESTITDDDYNDVINIHCQQPIREIREESGEGAMSFIVNDNIMDQLKQRGYNLAPYFKASFNGNVFESRDILALIADLNEAGTRASATLFNQGHQICINKMTSEINHKTVYEVLDTLPYALHQNIYATRIQCNNQAALCNLLQFLTTRNLTMAHCKDLDQKPSFVHGDAIIFKHTEDRRLFQANIYGNGIVNATTSSPGVQEQQPDQSRLQQLQQHSQVQEEQVQALLLKAAPIPLGDTTAITAEQQEDIDRVLALPKQEREEQEQALLLEVAPIPLGDHTTATTQEQRQEANDRDIALQVQYQHLALVARGNRYQPYPLSPRGVVIDNPTAVAASDNEFAKFQSEIGASILDGSSFGDVAMTPRIFRKILQTRRIMKIPGYLLRHH